MARAKKVKINYLIDINWANFHPNNSDYNKYMHQATEHARLEMSSSELRNHVLHWFKTNDPSNFQGLELVDEWKFHIVGKYYWILNMSATLRPESIDWLAQKIKPVLDEAKILVKKHEKYKSKDISVIKREYTAEDQGKFLAQDLEDLILTNELTENPDSAYNLLKKAQPKPAFLRSTIKVLNDLIHETQSFTDQEIEEGFLTKKSYERALTGYRFLLQTAKTFSQNSRRVRKTKRKGRAVSVNSKKLEKLNENASFKTEDTKLKLISVEPSKLVGAKAGLVYNTKTRKIGLYIAEDSEKGFEMRGTTIYGYNEEKSIQKTLRKPIEQIESFRKVAQKRVEIVLNDYIRAKAQILNGRINEHTVIMQVW